MKYSWIKCNYQPLFLKVLERKHNYENILIFRDI